MLAIIIIIYLIYHKERVKRTKPAQGCFPTSPGILASLQFSEGDARFNQNVFAGKFC